MVKRKDAKGTVPRICTRSIHEGLSRRKKGGGGQASNYSESLLNRKV